MDNKINVEELKDLSLFQDLFTALSFASKYRSAKLFGVNDHPDVDATALLEIECTDEEVQAMWQYTYQHLRSSSVDVPRRRLEELQAVYRWMMQQADLLPQQLNG